MSLIGQLLLNSPGCGGRNYRRVLLNTCLSCRDRISELPKAAAWSAEANGNSFKGATHTRDNGGKTRGPARLLAPCSCGVPSRDTLGPRCDRPRRENEHKGAAVNTAVLTGLVEVFLRAFEVQHLSP